MQLTSLSLAISRIMGGGAWSPFSLFAAGEQGAWYDPSDLTTLFQDSAGTTPVTGVEQRVGKMLDKSGRGNHAFQATTTPNDKRPILSARANLLTKTEDFSDAAWAKSGLQAFGSGSIANATIAPNGTQTADFIAIDGSIGVHGVSVDLSSTYASVSCKTRVCLKYKDWQYVTILGPDLNYSITVDVINGTYTIKDATIVTSISVTKDAASGWVTVSFNQPQGRYLYVVFNSGSTPNISFDGSAGAGKGFYLWGADHRPSSIGNNIPAYQRVNTATDYDTTGFPYYLKADGAYTSMSTNSINFSATNKMSIMSGVRKLSDAAQGVVSELSATSASNNGSFTLSAPGGAATNYTWLSKGTTADTVTATPYTSPISGVLTGLASISAPSNTIRVNGTATSDTNTQGTGNYGNYPIYLFARNNSSNFLNGYFYGAIIRGDTTSGTDLTNAESYMNKQSGGLY